jgi:hypothetical protein
MEEIVAKYFVYKRWKAAYGKTLYEEIQSSLQIYSTDNVLFDLKDME